MLAGTGFASGLMSTAHEIGAGIGSAALPAVAAAGLAVLAARVVPSVRPAAAAKVAVH